MPLPRTVPKSPKVKLGTIPLVYPIPIVLAGANVQGRANAVTLGDCGHDGVGTDPLRVGQPLLQCREDDWDRLRRRQEVST